MSPASQNLTGAAQRKMKSSGVAWLGEVPEGWTTKRLSAAATLNPSKSECRGLQPETEVSFVPMEAVGTSGKIEATATRTFDSVQQGYTYFRDGDVLLAKITPCFENGKGCIARGLVNGLGFGTTELHVLRPGPDADPRFLYYLSVSDPVRKLGAAEMYGAGGQKRVPDSFLKTMMAPVPPLPEERTIADYLDAKTAKIDGLIEKKRRFIELLQEKRTALISHAVTKGLNPNVRMKPSGVGWLGEVPEHWAVHALRRVVSAFVDYRGQTPSKTDAGIPLVTAGAVKDGAIDHGLAPEFIAESDYHDWMSRGLPESGDIIITTEAPLGEVAMVVDVNVAFAQRIILFKVNGLRMLAPFLRYYYLSMGGRSELLSRGSGSTATGIRADRLRASLVLVPPLPEQEDIVRFLDDRVPSSVVPIASVESAIARLQEYRTAVITAAVTGKISVS